MQISAYKLIRIVKNTCIAAQVSARHLADNPVLLALQVARKAPHSTAQKVARFLSKVPGAGTQALGAQMQGKSSFHQPAHELLKQQVSSPWQKLQKRVAAEVAIGYGLIDWRDEQIPTVTRARAAWDMGAVSEAISLADEAGAKSYASRLKGEAQLLDPEFTVQAPKKQVPESQELSALHLLTNSTPATQSGYTLRSQRLLSALECTGVNVKAFTRIGYPVMVGSLFAQDTAVDQNITYRRILPMRLATTHPGRLEQYARVVLKNLGTKPSVVHTTTNYPNALVAQAVARATGAPWVYEARGVMEETWVSNKRSAEAQAEAEQSERFRLIRERETQLMNRADHVVTLSETMKQLFVSRGVPAEKITVVPNAVDERLFELNLMPAGARAELGVPAEGFWVGSVSSLVDYEGFDTLLRATALLRAEGLDVRVLLAGDGVARAGLEQLAAELASDSRVGKFVYFLGKVAPSRAYIAHQALDVFVVPRRNDRVCRSVTPLKPIEAMALGRAVVMSDIPPLVELVDNGVTARAGKLAHAGDPHSFAAAIRELCEDDAARASLVAAGRDFARTRTWAHNAKVLKDLYRSLSEEAEVV